MTSGKLPSATARASVILVDTSIWVDHLGVGHPALVSLLDCGSVLGHPWVTAEVATAAEILIFVERHRLPGLGIGYVDAQLLAATRLTPDTRLWTDDKRLAAAGSRSGVLADSPVRSEES